MFELSVLLNAPVRSRTEFSCFPVRTPLPIKTVRLDGSVRHANLFGVPTTPPPLTGGDCNAGPSLSNVLPVAGRWRNTFVQVTFSVQNKKQYVEFCIHCIVQNGKLQSDLHGSMPNVIVVLNKNKIISRDLSQ